MSSFDNITTVSSRALHWCKKTLGRGRYGCVIEQVYVVIEGQQDYACACKSYGSTGINDTLLRKFKFHCGEYYELKHENLLEIKAIICDPAPSTIIPSILMELMDTNLFQRITEHPLPLSISLRILTEISDGLEYLHSKDIVHGHLSSSIILLNNQNRVKIGGFPFIELNIPNEISIEKQRFMAPEILSVSGTQGDKPADLYSYACIAIHLMSRKLPGGLTDSGSGDDIYTLVQKHVPPALQEKVVKPCLNIVPTHRPKIGIVKTLMVKISSSSGQDLLHQQPTESLPVSPCM